MKPPAWVDRINDRALAAGHIRRRPPVNWRGGTGRLSSGHCDLDGIVLTAGSDVKDRRAVYLHELTHWAVGHRAGHGALFYRTFYDLVRWDGRLVLSTVMYREGQYRAMAIKMARSLGIRGAKVAGRKSAPIRRAKYRPRGYCPVPLGECTLTRTPRKRHSHYVGMVMVKGVHYDIVPMPPPWKKEAA